MGSGIDVDRHKRRGVLHGAGWPLSKEPEVLDDGHKSGRAAAAAACFNLNNEYIMRKETIAEYLKRGGKVIKLPELKDNSLDYFSRGKVKPKNGARLELAELLY